MTPCEPVFDNVAVAGPIGPRQNSNQTPSVKPPALAQESLQHPGAYRRQVASYGNTQPGLERPDLTFAHKHGLKVHRNGEGDEVEGERCDKRQHQSDAAERCEALEVVAPTAADVELQGEQ